MTLPAILVGLVLAAAPGRGGIDPAAVGHAIAERRARVTEFRLIKEAAEELGIRVWLFGGTAAGFAHYVRWDLAREPGDERYRESFFDYDFTNIYRSTQDADLVVDATPSQAEQLESLIREKMSFLQGSKEHWEVRLLRYPRNAGGQVKLPLLDNPDFLEQHTDSNSTGMVELTDPPRGEGVVRDLRDWEGATPFFLQDVTAGRLHYYLSPTHEKTSRYLAGDNPPLFSVIRYLVKAFQYGLAVDGDDLQKVRAIIEAFDPKGDYARLSPWAKGWLERYGPNLIRHSVNVEYAWDVLEELGLRRKLTSLSDPSQEETLGWWLSKEPLRSRPVGEGSGKSARELGLEVVAHETRDFLAYESITRDTTLRPNVLISRPGHPGEAAALGPGFYTQRGRTGARGTGLTIRFQVDPEAREGADFTVTGDGRVCFTNRAALQVIPESLEASLLQYFEMLRNGLLDRNDRGAWIKLRRRLSLRPVQPEEEAGIVAIVSTEIDRVAREGGTSQILQEWFALPTSAGYPELTDRLYAAVSGAAGASKLPPLQLVHAWYDLPVSRSRPLPRDQEERIVAAVAQAIDRFCRAREKWGYHSSPSGSVEFIFGWLAIPLFRAHPELMEPLVQRKALGMFELGHLPGWLEDPRFVLSAISRTSQEVGSSFQYDFVDQYLWRPQWRLNPGLRALCGGQDPTARCLKAVVDRELRAEEPTGRPSWENPDLILALLEWVDPSYSEGRGAGERWLDSILSAPDEPWKEAPGLRELCGGNDADAACLRGVLARRSSLRAAGDLATVTKTLSRSPGPGEDCQETP